MLRFGHHKLGDTEPSPPSLGHLIGVGPTFDHGRDVPGVCAANVEPPLVQKSCVAQLVDRVENGGFRWISYQEAREQEFIAPDDELLGIIGLGRNVK